MLKLEDEDLRLNSEYEARIIEEARLKAEQEKQELEGRRGGMPC